MNMVKSGRYKVTMLHTTGDWTEGTFEDIAGAKRLVRKVAKSRRKKGVPIVKIGKNRWLVDDGDILIVSPVYDLHLDNGTVVQGI